MQRLPQDQSSSRWPPQTQYEEQFWTNWRWQYAKSMQYLFMHKAALQERFESRQVRKLSVKLLGGLEAHKRIIASILKLKNPKKEAERERALKQEQMRQYELWKIYRDRQKLDARRLGELCGKESRYPGIWSIPSAPRTPIDRRH